MPYGNPILAGSTLARVAIKSMDYETGVSGWAIFRSGNAEFNDVVVRGELIVSGPNSSQLHAYVSTVTVDGVSYSVPVIDFDAGVGGFSDPSIYTFTAGNYVYLAMESARRAGQLSSRIMLRSGAIGDASTAILTNADDFYVQSLNGAGTPVGGRLLVGPDATDLGRGWIAGGIILANRPVVNATETVQLTALDRNGATPTYRANRVYRVEVTGSAVTTNVATQPLMRVRKTNTAGQQFGAFRVPCPSSGLDFPASYTVRFRVGASNVAADIVLTLIGAVSPTDVRLSGAATSPSAIDVYDEGDYTGTGNAHASLPVLV